MSVNTWTPTALASEAKPWQGTGWRAVEAQNQVATMGLVHGDARRQSILEDILEEAKPSQPTDTQGLHWLLFTPFRYQPLPEGSRFRRRQDPGVFYGAVDRETACAESSYWRLRFWLDSEYLHNKMQSVQITLFEFRAATQHSIDLTAGLLAVDAALWTNPKDYAATQALANAAREAGVEVIRYESVRNRGGECLALLTPEVFRSVAHAYWENTQGWTLTLYPPGKVVWQRTLSSESWTFEF